MTPLMILTTPPAFLTRAWAVYTLHDSAGTFQFIGTCRLAQISSTPDARANKFFQHIFPDGWPMTLTLLSVHPSRKHGLNEVWKHIQVHGRPFMLAHGTTFQRGIPVVCNETGEKFTNSRAAAFAHGLTTSALSNHLARKPGHMTVRGKTYKYGQSDDDRPVDPTFAFSVET